MTSMVKLHRGLFAQPSVRGLRGLIETHFGPLDLSKGQKLSLLQTLNPTPNPAPASLSNAVLSGFWRSGVPKLYQRYTGFRPMLIHDFCTVRVQPPTDSSENVPWHLDANFWNFETPLLTFWIALSPAGKTAPGLTIAWLYERPSAREITDRYRVFAQEKLRNGKPISMTDDELLRMIGRYRIRSPIMNAGDVLLFNQLTFHRTQTLSEAVDTRLAIEFRVVPRSPLPKIRGKQQESRTVSFADEATGKLNMTTVARLYEDIQ